MTAQASPARTSHQQEKSSASLTVEFARSGKKISTDGKTPLLDIAEELDIDLDYGCRSGNCGVCKARLLKGKVDMENQEGLEQKEKDDGYILTCVAKPLTERKRRWLYSDLCCKASYRLHIRCIIVL